VRELVARADDEGLEAVLRVERQLERLDLHEAGHRRERRLVGGRGDVGHELGGSFGNGGVRLARRGDGGAARRAAAGPH